MSISEDTKKYVLEILEYLDGRGIIITDDELVDNALKEVKDITELQI